MPAEPENILLQYMRRFDKRFDDIEQKLQDVTARMASIEEQLVFAKQEANLTRADIAPIDARLDRMEERLRGIERRLDLVEA
jgi:septal ring factor EnvC (AmiA/AmiB activator)